MTRCLYCSLHPRGKMPLPSRRCGISQVACWNSLRGLLGFLCNVEIHVSLGNCIWVNPLKLSTYWKRLMMGKIESRRRRGRQRMRWLVGITDSVDMNLGKLGKTVRDGEARCAAVHGVTKSWTRLNDRMTTMKVVKRDTERVDKWRKHLPNVLKMQIIILLGFCCYSVWGSWVG